VRHPVTLQHLQEGHPQDFDIEPETLTLQIFRIQRNLLGNGKFITPINLRPACQPRHEGMHPILGAQINQVVLVELRNLGILKILL